MIADFATLCRMSGYKRPVDVRAWLAKRRIKYLVGKGGKPSTHGHRLDAPSGAEKGQTAYRAH